MKYCPKSGELCRFASRDKVNRYCSFTGDYVALDILGRCPADRSKSRAGKKEVK